MVIKAVILIVASFALYVATDVNHPFNGAFGDLNDDGTLDLLVASLNDGKSSYNLGKGSGSFAGQKLLSPDAYAMTRTTTFDPDLDGLDDILVSNHTSNMIAWFKGETGAEFSSRILVTDSASDVSVIGYVIDEQVASRQDGQMAVLTCAYDPNDKQVFPLGSTNSHYVYPDSTLEYLVRFQNVGNAPAIDVIIRDTIYDNLDLNSFDLLSNSHSVYTTIKPDDREVEFFFENIMLPDSVNNEPESHGFISYTLRPKTGLPLLTELNNEAHIFFDNNPAVITNTTWSTLFDCSLFEVNFNDDGALLTASEGDAYQWFLDGDSIPGAVEQ